MTKQRQTFVTSALQAEKEVMESGLVYDADEVFRYITAKIGSTPVTRPKTQSVVWSAQQTKA